MLKSTLLSLTYCNLIMMCLDVDFWTFILFVICGLRFSSNWVVFGQYFFQCASCLTLLFLEFELHMHKTTYLILSSILLIESKGFIFSLFFSLFASFLDIYSTCVYINFFFCRSHSPLKSSKVLDFIYCIFFSDLEFQLLLCYGFHFNICSCILLYFPIILWAC